MINIFGIIVAIPASNSNKGFGAIFRYISRTLLNLLRSIPELVWAVFLIISAGLGPFAGTLALMIHTTGIVEGIVLSIVGYYFGSIAKNK